MIKRNRNGRNYIELAVVIATLLIITLFVIPRYQNLKRDAYMAQIANDSMIIEKRITTRLSTKGKMPNEYKTISNENSATLVDSKNSYLKGELIKSNDVKAIGGSKYMLPKNDILDSINTKLKGEFIYTDNGVIYVDNVKSVDLDKVIPKVTGTAKPEHVLSGQTFANKYNLNLTGTMPNFGKINQVLTRPGETILINKGYYEGGEVKSAIPNKGSLNKTIEKDGKISLPSGYYEEGTVNVKNLKSTNIKKGVTIGGITGSYSGGGKIVYKSAKEQCTMNGSKRTVTLDDNTIGVVINIDVDSDPDGWYSKIGSTDLVFFKGESSKEIRLRYTGFSEKKGDWSSYRIRAWWNGNKVTFTPDEDARASSCYSIQLINLE